MSRLLYLLLPLLVAAQPLCAQMKPSKPPIDASLYGKWPGVRDAAITRDGRYALYVIDHIPVNSQTLVITGTDTQWKRTFPRTNRADFMGNNRFAIFKNSGDSLHILRLGSDKLEIVPGVKSHIVTKAKGTQWLMYNTIGKPDQLIIRNLASNGKQVIDQVKTYNCGADGVTVYIQVKKKDGIDLQRTDLRTGRQQTVWQGKETIQICFDISGHHLAFMSNDEQKTIWYYNAGQPAAVRLADSRSRGLEKGMQLERVERFASEAKGLIVRLTKKQPEPDASMVKLNIWHYKDARLQPNQLLESVPRTYAAVINITAPSIIQLEHDNEFLRFEPEETKSAYGMNILEVTNGGDFSEAWYAVNRRDYYLVSLKDGRRIKMKGRGYLSPGNRFYVYRDPEIDDYFSYEIATGTTRNITKDIPVRWFSMYNVRDKNGEERLPSGWIADDQAILLHDEFDIWEVCLLGNRPPQQLTGGIGKQQQIFFERIEEHPAPAKNGQSLVLAGFNQLTKVNGYYRVVTSRENKPEVLHSGNYLSFALQGATRVEGGSSIVPVKAADNETYIVRRMSANVAPSFFSTKDFKTYTSLSDIHPERDYNWYTTELHTWRSPLGKQLKGILYKPEDFDPSRKYPVIFHYYEETSNQLNCYLKPAPSGGSLNVLWYASNGYLVFMPDIEYTVGDPFEAGTYDCVVSAAKYLSSKKFVDSSRMAIQGISWGGIQTNYLVTHTNIFAAACTASGTADFVSHYNGLGHGDHSAQTHFEGGQLRVGFTPWERPDWYMKNSPIMHADKVSTPLLLFHTSIDHATRFEQAVEMYSALRRLGKKVWLLEYADGEHGVSGAPALDFDLRMQQFFNHYLKDAPAPKWMTQGRPSTLKGIETRLELDDISVKP